MRGPESIQVNLPISNKRKALQFLFQCCFFLLLCRMQMPATISAVMIHTHTHATLTPGSIGNGHCPTACLSVCLYSSLSVRVCAFARVRVCLCLVCACACVRACVYVCVCVCVCVFLSVFLSVCPDCLPVWLHVCLPACLKIP